jgi:type I restriction-modification system DNA methylase subunit
MGVNCKMILDYSKTFIAKLNGISHSRNSYETFNDFIYLASASLYSWKKDDQVEKEYMDIAKNYSVDELSKMSELLYILIGAFEKSEHGDFLGKVFMNLEYADKRNGQYFTPYHVSYLAAKMIIQEKEFPENRLCKISDPCCGSGGMLIAGAKIMEKRGFNYQHDALFIGQDIDHRCARMAFIQLSLLGIPAIIICGNTLTSACYWKRETIGYHIAGMDFRLHWEDALNKIKELETATENQKPVEIKLTTPFRKEHIQGELF